MKAVWTSSGLHNSANVIPRKPLPSSWTSHHLAKGNPITYTIISEPDGPSTRKPQTWIRRTWTNIIQSSLWAREFASIGFALVMLAAIVVLLSCRRDKPLPDWPSLLQINSLVAIFTSVFKVMLLFPITEGISELKWVWFAKSHPVTDFDRFDSASRGPFGAIKLLAKQPSNFLASLGAAIIVLALAVDPFTQQILYFYSWPMKVEGLTANVPRTNNYTLAVEVPFYTTRKATYTGPIDAKMAAAFYQGMLNPSANATAAISVYCASSNCTFPHTNNVAYSSLAMCSSVEDISSFINGSTSYSMSDAGGGRYQYSLPSGLNVTSPFALTTGGIAYEGNIYAEEPLFSFEVLMVTTNCSSGLPWNHTLSCPITPLAVYVTLSPCVLVYGNVSVTDSIFQEQVQSKGMLMNSGRGYASVGNYSSFPGIDCSASAMPQGNKTLPAASTFVNSDNSESGSRTVWCVDLECVKYATSSQSIVWYNPACVFSLNLAAAVGLTVALSDMFGWTASPQNLLFGESGDGIWSEPAGPVWLKVLWAHGMANVSSISKTIDGLTNAINAVFRQEGDTSNSAPAQGDNFSNQTFVGVRWPWIAYSFALVALTLVFLILTIAQSNSSLGKGDMEEGRRPWKSSTLPLLWCGLQDLTKGRHGRLDKLEQMMKYSNETWVNLRTEDEIMLRSSGQNAIRRGRWVLQEAD